MTPLVPDVFCTLPMLDSDVTEMLVVKEETTFEEILQGARRTMGCTNANQELHLTYQLTPHKRNDHPVRLCGPATWAHAVKRAQKRLSSQQGVFGVEIMLAAAKSQVTFSLPALGCFTNTFTRTNIEALNTKQKCLKWHIICLNVGQTLGNTVFTFSLPSSEAPAMNITCRIVISCEVHIRLYVLVVERHDGGERQGVLMGSTVKVTADDGGKRLSSSD